MVSVKFGSKKFEVKKNKIYTPDGISISESLDTEEKEVSGKKPTLNIKGVGLQSVSMSVKLDCRFVTVDDEIRYWKNLMLKKKSELLHIGNYQIGYMYVTSYKLSDIILNKNGEYTKATIELSFTEDGAKANKKKVSYNTTKKAIVVKASAKVTANREYIQEKEKKRNKVRKGSTVKPKKNTRWYATAAEALKKSGKSGKAYQKNMKVKYIYPKTGTISCVNLNGLGWMMVEEVTVIKY